jgi:predicted alpha/beta hydrolase family esterase
MKNVIIVHGTNEKDRENMIKYKLPPQNEREWIGWIKSKLDEKEIMCVAPLMPENWNPKYEDWKKEFEKNNIGENSILIGHSAGGGFLVRWLGETKKKIKKLILVAPAIIHSGGWKPLNDLLKFEIDKSVGDNVNEIIIFVSNDDIKGIR